ncbi:AcrR family transcriptional regulator [Caulobacter ginsengisoli]|uniref:AcrR family transcriptional regulator n=1 Tax=Caulobacter ginsengisoli TaxID=400775 RepID=A0ABU0IT58_9CAUL|nr:TetR family transcriptional regulator [Caulobacter ginsengisoli]MDQ0465169.1 AcrR family transcriptional regulator [Caulobacter ginsengisoli]
MAGAGRRDAHAEATRALIIRQARTVFAARGFADAGLAEIVAAARVTTGAVYHHFGDKKGLFLAVAEAVEADILTGLGQAAATHSDPWEQLMAGVEAMLEICARPDVQRIVFRDAPTVIGPAAWREIELRYGFGVMRSALEALIARKIIRQGSADVLASIMLGALIEAAGAIARAEDQAGTALEARETVRRLFAALRSP